jgi:hypothetical protein
VSAFRTQVPRSGVGLLPPRRLRASIQKLLPLATWPCRDFRAAYLCVFWDVSRLTRQRRNTVQTKQTITLSGTVSNSVTSRISKKSRNNTDFGIAIISDCNLQAFQYNVVAFGKQGHFAKALQAGTRSKLVIQAQSNETISPLSHSSPQPSRDRFVKSHASSASEPEIDWWIMRPRTPSQCRQP